MITPIHPFPARMAPELAISSLQNLGKQSVVLDPMSGSGTVIRHASDLGHQAIGVDMDPLAVLMTKVWTTPVSDTTIERLQEDVVLAVYSIRAEVLALRLPDSWRITLDGVNGQHTAPIPTARSITRRWRSPPTMPAITRRVSMSRTPPPHPKRKAQPGTCRRAHPGNARAAGWSSNCVSGLRAGGRRNEGKVP